MQLSMIQRLILRQALNMKNAQLRGHMEAARRRRKEMIENECKRDLEVLDSLAAMLLGPPGREPELLEAERVSGPSPWGQEPSRKIHDVFPEE